MSTPRHLELDIHSDGHKSSVKVDGVNFPCDRLRLVSDNAAQGVAYVELRYLAHDGVPYHVQGKMQPLYIGPADALRTFADVATQQQKHEPIDIDIHIGGSVLMTLVTINGERFNQNTVSVDVKLRDWTHVTITYTNYDGREFAMSGYMMPEPKE